MLLVDEVHGADVHAPGGLAHHAARAMPKENSRASTTFCMLPPLRDPAGSSTPEVRISKVRVSSCAYFFTCPRLRWIPRRLNAGVRCLAHNQIFGHAGLHVHAGGDAVLRDMAQAQPPGCVRGSGRSRRRPQRVTLPPMTGRMPATHSASSVWPLPSTPHTPTTSPVRTVRSMPRSAGQAAVAQRAQAADDQALLPGRLSAGQVVRKARRAPPSARRSPARWYRASP